MNNIASRILFEDNHLIVFNKIGGEIVQVDKTGDASLEDTLKEFLKKRDNKPGNVYLGIPHRLDRPVSGCLLVAKTSKALARLNEMFQKGEIHKTYWAITGEKPKQKQARLEDFIYRNEKNNKSYISDSETKQTKKAILEYVLEASSDRYHLLSIQLLTGRHHQIRCQLAGIGCPIKGDLKYGSPRSNPDKGISLHARSIEFEHPVTKDLLSIKAPVPSDSLWQFFETTLSK